MKLVEFFFFDLRTTYCHRSALCAFIFLILTVFLLSFPAKEPGRSNATMNANQSNDRGD